MLRIDIYQEKNTASVWAVGAGRINPPLSTAMTTLYQIRLCLNNVLKRARSRQQMTVRRYHSGGWCNPPPKTLQWKIRCNKQRKNLTQHQAFAVFWAICWYEFAVVNGTAKIGNNTLCRWMMVTSWFQMTTNRKSPMGNRMVTWSMTSCDPDRSSRDPNTLRAQYLENSWRCYLATIVNY